MGGNFAPKYAVIEAITDESLESLVHRVLFEPLNLRATTLSWSGKETLPSADGHDHEGQPTVKDRSVRVNAAASLHTTLTEFAMFVTAVLRPLTDRTCYVARPKSA